MNQQYPPPEPKPPQPQPIPVPKPKRGHRLGKSLQWRPALANLPNRLKGR